MTPVVMLIIAPPTARARFEENNSLYILKVVMLIRCGWYIETVVV